MKKGDKVKIKDLEGALACHAGEEGEIARESELESSDWLVFIEDKRVNVFLNEEDLTHVE